ncbi:MAG: hypothetical protein RLZZ303_577 [Candidatus Hydrogenedentota bacterium]|jgi:DNA polymerase
MANSLDSILNDIATLLKRTAGRTGELHLAPENVAWLESLAASPAEKPAPKREATVATAAAPAKVAPASPAMRQAAPHGADEADSLEALAAAVSRCHRCGLCETRTQTVFGSGNPKAELVFVGEAPGADEDKQGLPFVGAAGQLLTTIIEHPRSMGLSRNEVYICNVLKCRPPGNRNPAPEEMTACEPYLVRQLQLIQPRVICALGGYAAKQLLKTDDPVGRLRGKWHFYHGIPVRVTYHPSYLLRCSGEKERQEKQKVWDDVMAVLRLLKGEETVRS